MSTADAAGYHKTMSALNHGNVMEAAARNLMKEMARDAAAGANEGASRGVVDMQDLEQARALGLVCSLHLTARLHLLARAGRGAGAAAPRPHRADEGARGWR